MPRGAMSPAPNTQCPTPITHFPGSAVMSVEYRSARADEMREFTYGSVLGFGNTTSDAEVDRLMASDFIQPEQTLCAVEDGVLASQMATLPAVMRWNGREIGCGAVTAVTTLPTHRRRGHLRAIMTRAFATMRDEGQPVAMLWASMAAIYQRFGYGIVYTLLNCDFDPRTPRFIDEIATPGRVRLVKGDAVVPVIAEPYARFAAARTGMFNRDEMWWHKQILRPWRPETPPFLVAVYEEGAAVQGYCVYEVAEHPSNRPGPDQQIRVRELIWLTPAAHRALLRYVMSHDLVGSVRMTHMPTDDPLFYHVEEPRLLDLRARDGTLLRIVDAPAALEGRGYDAEGRVTFVLNDDMCPWNEGMWELAVEGGQAHVKRASGEAEMRLTPRALALVACGHQPASTLARIGMIDGNQDALATTDRLFHTTYAPLCLDNF